MQDVPGSGKGGLRSRFSRRAQLAVQNRTVFSYLAGVTAVTAVATGLIAHLVDRADFPTFGTGVWWAIVTLGTVGYGDVVPHTAPPVEEARDAQHDETALLRTIEARLEAIETRLGTSSDT